MKQLIFPILVILGIPVAAQQKLSTSPQTSAYTYVYKIPDEKLLAASNHFAYGLPVDSITDARDYAPPPGNYVLVKAVNNTLETRRVIVNNIFPLLVSNRDLLISLHNLRGEEVQDAQVTLGQKTISYDPAVHAYRLKKYKWQHGIVLVRYEGQLNAFNINRREASFRSRRTRVQTPDHQGYIVFNKPVYKPNDTVKVKAFITNKKGMPVSEALSLRLTSPDEDTDTVLAVLNNYRPGGYTYEFVVTDTLELDENYTVSLENGKQTLLQGQFRLEEYELKKIRFSAQLNREEHQRQEHVHLTIHATDENDLPLLDGRVKVSLTRRGFIRSHAPTLFLPDTLWQTTIPVDPVGEMIIPVPDSIFPRGEFTYRVNCQLLNTENESLEKTIFMTYNDEEKSVRMEEKGDSLYVHTFVAGQSVQDTGTLIKMAGKAELGRMRINMPAVIKLDPYTSTYVVGNEVYETAPSQVLDCETSRSKDSVRLRVHNPYQVPFWYTIYAGRKIVARGYTQALDWHKRTYNQQHYTLIVQYLRSNTLQRQQFTADYAAEHLQVAIQAPATIAPGEQSDISITVTDIAGRPVADADITAYGITSKFAQSHAPVPYTGKRHPSSPVIRSFTANPFIGWRGNHSLNYTYWRNIMRLDTILWYQFTHPAPLWRYEEPAMDSVTQIAPFAMTAGQSLQVSVVYIDHIPVYYYKTAQVPVYSFRTTPGKHQVQLRTSNMLITFDSILIQPGVKNFVSVDPFHPPQGVTVQKKKLKLSAEEINGLNPYLVELRYNFPDQQSYLRQGDQLILLQEGRKWGVLAGPLKQEPVTFAVYDYYSRSFTPAQGYAFDIRIDSIRQVPAAAPIPKKSYAYGYGNIQNLGEQVATFISLNTLTKEDPDFRLMTELSYGDQLRLKFPDNHPDFPNYTVLFRYDDSTFVKAGIGGGTFGGIAEGMYQVLFLYDDNKFMLMDSVRVRPGGMNFYAVPSQALRPLTDMSVHHLSAIQSIVKPPEKDNLPVTYGTRTISGLLLDDNDMPIPGGTIRLEGTRTGATSDISGHFIMRVPDAGFLRVMYVGYETVNVRLTSKNYYMIRLAENHQALSEVIVTAYGSAKKRTLNFEPDLMKNDKVVAEPTIRNHFKDDAFWQPQLRTDENGRVSFKAHFPQDLTSWRVFALAMNDHKQGGTAEVQVRSFLPVSANLGIPSFAIAGDSMNIIGKGLNYTNDPLPQTSRTLRVNDSVRSIKTGPLAVTVIDSLAVNIPATDSMHFSYSLRHDKYQDGEERSLPVFPVGSKVYEGFFAAMHNDTAITYMPVMGSPVKIYAEAALLPVLEKEMTYLQDYRYGCNEQLASRLMAYLLEKQVAAYRKKPFRHNGEIYSIINRLSKTGKRGWWGWWEETDFSPWVTLHVMDALTMAQEQGYDPKINVTTMANDLLSMYNSGQVDSIGCLLLLSRLKVKVNADRVYARNGYDSLRLLTLAQQEKRPVNLQPMLAKQQATMFGNAYWGRYSNDLFHNSVQYTLMMYRLLRQEGGHEALLQKIRGYFLEEKRNGHWRNTYESSLILATILPDIMQEEKKGKAAITLNKTIVDRFPFDTTLAPGKAIFLSKKGGLPVYLTCTQEYWDQVPQPLGNTFRVTSGIKDSILEAGRAVELTVNVYANADAEYVLVEIPIPAGCSYAAKPQSWENGEVHREYEKQQVSIFCASLTRGMHTFRVKLMPRYSGVYYLNPAKAEMQYFPLFMGRTGLKKVIVR